MELTKQDLEQLEGHGISPVDIGRQVEKLNRGSLPIELKAPATGDKGIKILTPGEQERAIRRFNSGVAKLVLASFIPASGAASRMFRLLEDSSQADSAEFIRFIEGLNQKKFAFYPALRRKMKEAGRLLEEELKQKNYSKIIEYLLGNAGLRYRNRPKGLIEFHHYRDFSRTAFAEHLQENILFWGQPKWNFIHFTINPKFKRDFEHELELCSAQVTGSHRLSVEFSEQRESTNTIALDARGRLFRNEDGTLLLRPAGHGALIHNLDEINSDLVFIKNIDNVVHDRFKEVVIRYRKILAGFLLRIQARSFEYIKILRQPSVSPDTIDLIVKFAREELNIDFPPGFHQQGRKSQQKDLIPVLNRPLRVCGMVKNTGEPGGGPFFVTGRNGAASLQIIEGAQIDRSSARQMDTLKKSTHFNPVDLVCGIKDFSGRKFKLLEFVDEALYLVTEKFQDGKPLNALELPGLWNGAMAGWNTVFVEIPLETFNPVKTVNDLLRPAHQEK